MQLKIKKFDPRAILPKFQTAGAACFDLHAVVPDGQVERVGPQRPAIIETGLAFEVPAGHVLLIFSRSGQGFNHNVRLSNCTGVIDADYIGQVKVKLTKDSGTAIEIKHGDRIAQAMLLALPECELVEVDELMPTARGTAGFGSTGA